MTFFAHSENSAGIKHDLVEHLKSVAQLAGKFAEKFGAADFGYWAGLWHGACAIDRNFHADRRRKR